MSVYKVGDPVPPREGGPLVIPSLNTPDGSDRSKPTTGGLLCAENQYGADIQVIKLGNSCPNILLLLLEGEERGVSWDLWAVSAILELI